MKNYQLSTIIICVLIFIVSAQNERYKDSVFTCEKPKTVTYRISKDYKGITDTLDMDLYFPDGDTISSRPSILVLYGGSFSAGSRKDSLIVALCSDFVKHGYVAAAIDYRIGVDILDISKSYPAAVYRAIQDSRAAARYLRKNAAMHNLDKNRIFGCGYSAGAVIVLHHAYIKMDEAKKMFDTTGLGLLDEGDYCEQDAHLNAVVNLSGFIGDTNWICDKSVPALSFHGTIDAVIPYNIGHPLGLIGMPKVYGGAAIARAAQRNGVQHKLIPFENKGHDYDDEMRSQVLQNTYSFLYPLTGNSMSIHDGLITWKSRKFDFSDKQSMKEFDLRGRQVSGNTGSVQLYLRAGSPGMNKVIPRF